MKMNEDVQYFKGKFMKCVDRESNEIDLNQWEILGRLTYKKNVDVIYLRNKWRTPEQEQIFLVGYQSQAGEKNHKEM